MLLQCLKVRQLSYLIDSLFLLLLSLGPTSDADKLLQGQYYLHICITDQFTSQELRQSDLSLRNELIQITEIKVGIICRTVAETHDFL
jgi:hypothetical protein